MRLPWIAMTDSLPDRMIRLMSDGKWHSSKELAEKISHRFSATKHVLVKRGYEFDVRRIQGQEYEYRLAIESNAHRERGSRRRSLDTYSNYLYVVARLG